MGEGAHKAFTKHSQNIHTSIHKAFTKSFTKRSQCAHKTLTITHNEFHKSFTKHSRKYSRKHSRMHSPSVHTARKKHSQCDRTELTHTTNKAHTKHFTNHSHNIHGRAQGRNLPDARVRVGPVSSSPQNRLLESRLPRKGIAPLLLQNPKTRF